MLTPRLSKESARDLHRESWDALPHLHAHGRRRADDGDEFDEVLTLMKLHMLKWYAYASRPRAAHRSRAPGRACAGPAHAPASHQRMRRRPARSCKRLTLRTERQELNPRRQGDLARPRESAYSRPRLTCSPLPFRRNHPTAQGEKW